jgi:hypothetical protein
MPRNAVVEPAVLEDFILEGFGDFTEGRRRRLLAVPYEARLFAVALERRLRAVPSERRLFGVVPGSD